MHSLRTALRCAAPPPVMGANEDAAQRPVRRNVGTLMQVAGGSTSKRLEDGPAFSAAAPSWRRPACRPPVAFVGAAQTARAAPDRPCRDQDGLDQFIRLATLLITFETLLPTVVNAVMAATAISEAISVYSMAVAPCSFFIRRRKMDSIGISKGKSSLTGAPVHRSPVLGTAEMIDTNAWGR